MSAQIEALFLLPFFYAEDQENILRDFFDKMYEWTFFYV